MVIAALHPFHRRLGLALFAAALLSVPVQAAWAQAAARPPASPASAPGLAPAPIDPATGALALALARSILIAVHQANVTGNYTVLRDLGAPAFHDRNTAADLAESFAPIRKARIDLSTAASTPPEITGLRLDSQGVLDLSGRLKTPTGPVRFEMLFQPVAGAWRLFGVSLAPETAPSPPPATPAPAAPRSH